MTEEKMFRRQKIKLQDRAQLSCWENLVIMGPDKLPTDIMFDTPAREAEAGTSPCKGGNIPQAPGSLRPALNAVLSLVEHRFLKQCLWLGLKSFICASAYVFYTGLQYNCNA